MSPQPTPEIQRTPLEALLLQIKSTRPSADVRDYLGRALNPPDVKAIESAWATLGMLGAIQDAENDQAGLSARLTPLGSHLAMIPVDVRLAKVSVLHFCDVGWGLTRVVRRCSSLRPSSAASIRCVLSSNVPALAF